MVAPHPQYTSSLARPLAPLQTSFASQSPAFPFTPTALSQARSPAPPVPGPPAQPFPYSHPPPSSVAPFPYPRAPLPLTPNAQSPASPSTPISSAGPGAHPAHTLHPYTFPLPSPSAHSPHLPSPSASNPPIAAAGHSLPVPHPRPPPLQLPTSSPAPPPPPPSFFVTDEGPVPVPPSAGASPASHHRQHFYPAVGAAPTSAYPHPSNGLGPRAHSVISPRSADKVHPHAYPAPLPVPGPKPMPGGYQGGQQPPMPQPAMPPPQAGYQAAPQLPMPPPLQGPPLPQYPQQPAQGYGDGAAYPTSAQPAPTPGYTIPPALPPRYSWVQPVSPVHLQLASSHFPDSPELLEACQIPFGVFMKPLGPGLSLPVSDSNPPPGPSTAVSPMPSTPASPSQTHARVPSTGGVFTFNAPPTAGRGLSSAQAGGDWPYIPVVRPGQAGVVRCKECKAYINGYVTWLDQGRAWKCNICLADNPVSSAYFSPLSAEGRRSDWEERDELRCASYELLAPKDYMVRPPVPPLVCLCIDVSAQAVQRGMLRDVCAAMAPLLEQMAQHPKALLSLVTFSDTVHYYTISNRGNGPSMHVLSTLDDLFLPAPIGLLIRVADCRAQLLQLLHSLPTIHAAPPSSPVCTASALECCMMIMGRYGGRLMTFVSSICGVGHGLMTDRERDALEKAKGDAASGVEAALLKPAPDNFYKKLSESMQKHQITCDLLFFPPSYGQNPHAPAAYVDVTTYSELARYTGGQVYYFPHYTPAAAAALGQTLVSILSRPQCFESVFRVRVSRGVVISDFHGHFSIRGTDLLSLPCVDSEKGVSFELKIDEKDKSYVVGNKDRVVTIQTGLLYTSFVGERRIIVHTVVIPLAKDARRLVEGLNVDVCLGLMSKRAVWLAYAHSLAQAREFIRQKCGSLVRVMQKTQAAPPAIRPPPQAYMPALPLTALCLYLMKAAFAEQGVLFIPPDQRAYLLSTLYVLPLSDSLRLIQPALIPLHLLLHDPRYGTLQPVGDPSAPTSALLVPPSAPLSRSSLTPDSLLLLHNAVSTMLRVGSQADPWLVSQVVEEEGGGGWRMKARVAGLSGPGQADVLARVWDVVDEVRRASGLLTRVVVVRDGDAVDGVFQAHLLDDARGKEPSLQDWEHALRRGAVSRDGGDLLATIDVRLPTRRAEQRCSAPALGCRQQRPQPRLTRAQQRSTAEGQP